LKEAGVAGVASATLLTEAIRSLLKMVLTSKRSVKRLLSGYELSMSLLTARGDTNSK